ncbi:MAG: DUF2191 domain-containing protein [Planctomycetes bacterium]|nr:DUF2191 domain-containing protein [Planctomycetota bacterium]
MRTTLDINDALLIEAKRIAVERRTSLTAVVEDGLRAVVGLRLRDGGADTGAWPVSYEARPVEGIDLTRSADLLDRAEDRT